MDVENINEFGILGYKGKVVNNDPMTNPDDGWVEGWYFEDLKEGKVRSYIYSCPCKWEVFPESVAQYTGFKDKKGIPIYVKDIVKSIGTRDTGTVISRDGAIKVYWDRFDISTPLKMVNDKLLVIGWDYKSILG